MIGSIAHIGAGLKAARKQKELSQRELSKKTKVPQSHISKIENGAIDLQTSSLIQISRALEMELMLVPNHLIPTFKSLLRGDNKTAKRQIPMYRLDLEEEDEDV
jgi:transcriptional regulator with XRE-family HTH domain